MRQHNHFLSVPGTGECVNCGGKIGTRHSVMNREMQVRLLPGRGQLRQTARYELRSAATDSIDREVTLSGSVGQGGTNNPRDVSAVQGLLSSFVLSGQLSPGHLITPSGQMSAATVSAIREFQERVVGLSRPDGRVDPGGRTLSELNRVGPTGVPYFTGVQEPVWPVETSHPSRFVVTQQDLNGRSRTRGFGAARPDGRRHQGVDLFGYHNDIVRAVVGGSVVDEPRHFYLGTDRVLIEGEGGVILYGELERGSAQALGIRKGKRVNPGDPIGRIGCMRRAGGRCTSHMLHLETYRSGITRRPQTLWRVGRKPPVELRDPTDLLRRAAARAQQSTAVTREVGSGSRRATLAPGLEALLVAKREHDRRVIESEFPSIIQRSISASVGRGGINRPDDAHAVQLLLNTFIVAGRLPGIQPLTMDGVSGPKTIAAIEAFQRVFVGMNSPDGRVDPGGRTLEKLNGSIFQPAATSASAPAVQPIASQLPSGTGPKQLGFADIRRLAATAGLPEPYQNFLVFCAYGESRGNNLAGLGNPDAFPPWSATHRTWIAKGRPAATQKQAKEARAAVTGYRRNTWMHGCWPEPFYTFGSGGWFGLLPSSGLAVFRNTSLACQHPWSVFDGPSSVVMAMGMIGRLRRWPQFKANPTVHALRVGFGAPGEMNNATWLDQRHAHYVVHLKKVGLSATFLDEVLPALPSFDPVVLMRRLGGTIWLPA
jgi:peptidoglycan hydrolase-like protein with peptidoglycan-binding domain